jgi:mannose-6-phosphate isomerase-like protein (cupin superfamily)
MIQNIIHNNQQLAIIIKNDYKKDGVEFFTPNEYSQQLAYMSHKKGKKIDAHVHNEVKRDVHFTQEVLVIRKGKLRVDFYTQEKEYVESRIIEVGDVMLLSSGGHGFEVLEDLEMIEIKQGPYLGDEDKTRFEHIEETKILVKEKL